MKAIDPKKVPLEHRFVELCAPGLLFADIWSVKSPHEDWADSLENFAKIMRMAGDTRVGFRRFVFDPGRGKVYLDEGWVYIRGVKVPKECILSGSARQLYPGIPINDIAIGNVKSNNCDCLWISQYAKLWPLYSEDTIMN